MNAIKLLGETQDTVTISRADLDALIDAAENAEDIASVRAWNSYVAAVGRDARSPTATRARKRSSCSPARALSVSGVRSEA